ncbi:hypothetical protein L2E82_45250 [Cichorium intybus]|uniref:Uncharacterized protein n=1 Tax=Cichorium intybus TaxID=13427 RepID=A0ACB8ZTG0_CICIN|nr:hypothetical protein L2E82_45250 [Cichorium intybus]
MRNIKMALRFEDREYVLEKELIEVDPDTATPEEYASYKKHYGNATKVACIMVATMVLELQRFYKDYWPYEMNKDLAEKFQSVCTHVQRMQRYVERLQKLNMQIDEELPIDMVLNSLLSCYDQFILAYHLNTQTTLAELHNMLQIAEDRLKGKGIPFAKAPAIAIGQGRGKKRKGPPKQNWKGKAQVGSSSNGPRSKPNSDSPHVLKPKEADCFYCNEKGHWKRSCPKYLQDLKDGKVKPSSAGLKESKEVEHERINLIMGNRLSSPVTKIGVYSLVLSTLPCDGMYETVTCIDNLGNSVLEIDSSNGIEKACLWHCRLGHINKKRIAQPQKDGVLESFDLKSDDVCESCLLGKMTKSPFTWTCESGKGLLDIIHTYVCGPFRSTTRDANRFYVTFTNDYSRYGCIDLIKHKSETVKKFKEFKNEVENKLGIKIKMLRSDRGSEYLSIEFLDYLKECGIVSQLTPPRTPYTTRSLSRERAHIKEDSGSIINLEEIQESTNEGTVEDTSTQQEEEVPVDPINNRLPPRRSGKVSMPPEFYGFRITTDGDTFVSDKTLYPREVVFSFRQFSMKFWTIRDLCSKFEIKWTSFEPNLKIKLHLAGDSMHFCIAASRRDGEPGRVATAAGTDQ